MDWKRFYADELNTPWGRELVHAAAARHAGGDALIRAALQAGGIATFPHVTLRDSAEPLARLAQSIIASGRPHVVALGVLHGGTLPPAFRAERAALNGTGAAAWAAFPRFAGGFMAQGAADTPFGRIEAGVWPAGASHIREDAELLGGEFSLDLFLAVLAAAAQQQGVRPPPVTRVYVSATRDPDGGFDVARALAADLRALIDADTVCVATGDLAHIGHGYMPPEQVAKLPSDLQVLQVLQDQLAIDLQTLHAAALRPEGADAAWALGTRWLSDQRHLLPVIAELVGRGARFDLLSLSLSDYANIKGQPAPCRVAAVLGVFRPSGS